MVHLFSAIGVRAVVAILDEPSIGSVTKDFGGAASWAERPR